MKPSKLAPTKSPRPPAKPPMKANLTGRGTAVQKMDKALKKYPATNAQGLGTYDEREMAKSDSRVGATTRKKMMDLASIRKGK